MRITETRNFYFVLIDGKEVPIHKSKGIGQGQKSEAEAEAEAERILAARIRAKGV